MVRNNSFLVDRSVQAVPSKRRVLLFTVIAFFVLAASLVIAETMPRFIDLPIPPPDYFKGGLSGAWMSESWSVLVLPPTAIPDVRVFILEKRTIVLYDEDNNIVSWKSITEYFDNKLDKLGWVRSETYSPCQTYLSQSMFLPENANNGYIYYRRREYKAFYDPEQSDVICLAVWGDQPDVFNVVFLTARPSYLTILSELIF